MVAKQKPVERTFNEYVQTRSNGRAKDEFTNQSGKIWD